MAVRPTFTSFNNVFRDSVGDIGVSDPVDEVEVEVEVEVEIDVDVDVGVDVGVDLGVDVDVNVNSKRAYPNVRPC